MQWWQVLCYGAGYLFAVIGLLDVLWSLWKCFVRRTPMGKMLLLARLDGDEAQVEGQARALVRMVDAWGDGVRLVVTASKPGGIEILQRMEKGGAPLHVCGHLHSMVWLQQVEEEAQGAIFPHNMI